MHTFQFGSIVIPKTQVFLTTPLSFCCVNLKPILPGHVLVISRRPVPRLNQLSPQEVADLFTTAQRVGGVIEEHYGATGLTVAVQDGEAAGQSVRHVHVHVIPRKTTDFGGHSDKIYELLEQDGVKGDKDGKGLDVAAEREGRSEEDMKEEAERLAHLFE